MIKLAGNYAGARLEVECKDEEHAATVIKIMHLDNPLIFDPLTATLMVMYGLSEKGLIGELDKAFSVRSYTLSPHPQFFAISYD
jgi:hypothetical protein